MPIPSLRIACALLVVVLTGCAPAQVRLPEGVGNDLRALPVTGISPRRAGDPVFFGPYSVRSLRDGGRRQDGASVGRAEFWQQWHPWRFTLTTTGQSAIDVDCEASRTALTWGKAGREVEIDLGGLEGPMLGCGFRRGPEAPPFVLELSRRGSRIAGQFDVAGTTYRIASLHHFEGSPLASDEPVGFEFVVGGRVAMVVDVLNQGQVLMSSRISPREQAMLAAAATALLTAGALDPG